MSYKGSDYEDDDDLLGRGRPPPYQGSATRLPPAASAPTTMHNTSSTTAAGGPVTVVTAQPTYPAAVMYQGNMNFVPVGVNAGPGPFIGPKESPMTCPSCQQRITTKVEYQATMRTHVCALMFCMVGVNSHQHDLAPPAAPVHEHNARISHRPLRTFLREGDNPTPNATAGHTV